MAAGEEEPINAVVSVGGQLLHPVGQACRLFCVSISELHLPSCPVPLFQSEEPT